MSYSSFGIPLAFRAALIWHDNMLSQALQWPQRYHNGLHYRPWPSTQTQYPSTCRTRSPRSLLTKSDVVFATRHPAAPLQHSGPLSSGMLMCCLRLTNGLMGIIMGHTIALGHQCRLSIHPHVVLGHQGPPDKIRCRSCYPSSGSPPPAFRAARFWHAYKLSHALQWLHGYHNGL